MRRHKNDISVGEGAWVDGRLELFSWDRAVNIDELLNETMGFWEAAETDCVVACCGVDALDLSPEGVSRAARESGADDLRECFAELHGSILSLGSACLYSNTLNQAFMRPSFLELLDHIQSVLAEWQDEQTDD